VLETHGQHLQSPPHDLQLGVVKEIVHDGVVVVGVVGVGVVVGTDSTGGVVVGGGLVFARMISVLSKRC